MTPEDQSRSDFEAWWQHEREQNSGHEIGADYRHWALLGWQASRRTYRASVLEEAAARLDELFYYSASAVVRALAAKTQEGQEP